jgi:hypothetical protein
MKGRDMKTSDGYRIKAARFSAMAREETNRSLQLEYARIAASYIRLAEMADRNLLTDVTYEPPLPPVPTK